MKLPGPLFPACVALITMLSHSSAYASVDPVQRLPDLDISAGGEISVSDNDVSMKPWSSKSFESTGKVQVVHYVAATRSAARQNKAFGEAVKERQFSAEKLDNTIIVNTANTMFLARGIIVDKLANRKSRRQEVNFVIDNDGVGQQRWGTKHDSYAIFILDGSGNVLFAKDGPLSETEIEQTIELIERQII